MAITAIKDLAPAGQVMYHGFDFGQLMKVMLDCKVEYDEADRTQRFNVYTLKVHSTVYASAATEPEEAAAMLNARQLLTEPGYNLDVTGQGFGDIKIRNDGTPNVAAVDGGSDLRWGPKPRLVHFEQHGSVCWELIWECEFALSECPSVSSSTLRNLMTNLNYQASYATDTSGLTTRAITGYIEVPQWYSENRNQLADAFREKLTVITPLGFQRITNQWTNSPDRTRVTFTIIDQEVPSPNAFPAGIVFASMPVSISNQNAIDFNNWTMSIGGFFQTAPGYPADHAFKKWYAAVKTILENTQKRLNGSNQFVLPQTFQLTIDKYRRTTQCVVVVYMACEIQNILSATGIWEPVPGANWAQWRASLASLWGPRGRADIKQVLNQDVIVDLCDNPSRGVTINEPARAPGDPLPAIIPIFGRSANSVSPKRSYIGYRNEVQTERRRNYILHRSLRFHQNPPPPVRTIKPTDPEKEDRKSVV